MIEIPREAGLGGLSEFEPRARRELQVFGAAVELVWLPQRAARPGRPTGVRPALMPSRAGRILAQETLWAGGGLAVTANRYPFAREQRILWPQLGSREHTVELLAAAFDWTDRLAGTALINGIGAAASIPHAHVHVTPERLPFLAGLRERPATGDFLPAVPLVDFVWKDVPFCLLGVRSHSPAARAQAVFALSLQRMTAAVTIVATDGAAWLLPRTLETPAPWFPYALGAAELWGRWCHVDEATFAAATAVDLERALVAAAASPVGSEVNDR